MKKLGQAFANQAINYLHMMKYINNSLTKHLLISKLDACLLRYFVGVIWLNTPFLPDFCHEPEECL
ncbi:hypothetical protein JHL17_22010 [Azospirillum sp. YIM B02556]|uniref:Transposase n=1 Tax=Azospirillum endophyticum TaxID=2800326 RepID=A0ABS1F9K1_9PROT|nr:hypothetical protein [Azospirillum endophyticum]MBK1840085.1 hypothetical protein [Azospirillum endophyticum]